MDARDLSPKSYNRYGGPRLTCRAVKALLNGRHAGRGTISSRAKNFVRIASDYIYEKLIEELGIRKATATEIQMWPEQRGLRFSHVRSIVNLRYVVAAAGHRSFQRATAALNISQPTQALQPGEQLVSSGRSQVGRGRRRRPLDRRRHRERDGRRQAGSHPGEANAARPADQPRHQH